MWVHFDDESAMGDMPLVDNQKLRGRRQRPKKIGIRTGEPYLRLQCLQFAEQGFSARLVQMRGHLIQEQHWRTMPKANLNL